MFRKVFGNKRGWPLWLTPYMYLLQFDVAIGLLDDIAEHITGFAIGLEQFHGLIGIFGVDRQHHANTHIEDIEHFHMIDFAGLLEHIENRQHRPRAEIDVRSQAVRNHTRNVFDEAAAGDMGRRP